MKMRKGLFRGVIGKFGFIGNMGRFISGTNKGYSAEFW